MCLRHTPAEACAPFFCSQSFPAGHVGPTLVSDASSAFCLHLGRGTPRVWYQDMKQTRGDVMLCLGATTYMPVFHPHVHISGIPSYGYQNIHEVSTLLVHDTCLDCTRTCSLQGRCGSQALTYWQPSRLVAPFYTSRSVPKHGNACMAYLLLRISLVSVLPVPCLAFALPWTGKLDFQHPSSNFCAGLQG